MRENTPMPFGTGRSAPQAKRYGIRDADATSRCRTRTDAPTANFRNHCAPAWCRRWSPSQREAVQPGPPVGPDAHDVLGAHAGRQRRAEPLAVRDRRF
ncbi:hypothetical protein K4749_13125 [Streptomyces sp. TRM72054]|uniref:hypothetical protein n=1 Tax=Streptomyces sp. TRM72054 TaxID=2870562 RepID=UPI001C8BC8AC|nr:hypothetical protein [Streptomyces sp. TRM72054]